MNLAELISSFRAKSLDEKNSLGGSDCDTLNSDELLTEFANEAQVEACRRGQLLVASTVVAVPAGAEDIAYPQSAIHITRSSIPERTAEFMDEHFPAWQDSPLQGTPQYLVSGVNSGRLALWPRPSQSCTIRLTCQRLPEKVMRAGADKPEIRPELHLSLVEWMLYRAYSRTDSDLFDPSKAAVSLANFEAEFGRKASGRNDAWVRHAVALMPGPIA